MGDDRDSQLSTIFHTLGPPTATELNWPGLSQFLLHLRIPKVAQLSKIIPRACPVAIQMLSTMLIYDLTTRVTARNCLAHAWFDVWPKLFSPTH